MPLTYQNDRPILLTPSILSADFARLGEQARQAQEAGADGLQIDVMDGMFVPNISVGLPIVAALKRTISITIDCHLMIVQPERYVADFVKAGAQHITVHAEATGHLHRTIQHIKELGATAGVAINPATPLALIDEIVPYVDLVLIMTVNPGFGGQEYIPTMTDKISRMRRSLDQRGLTHIPIQIDGGVKADNLAELIRAGASNLVVGSAIYNTRQSVAEAIAQLRAACA